MPVKMFEKIKNRILGEKGEIFKEFEKREGFPEDLEGEEVSWGEFRKILENQKPRVVYAKNRIIFDEGSWGVFYIRLSDNSVIRIPGYYPAVDKNGDVIISEHSPRSALDNLPYHEIVCAPRVFRYKFILKDSEK